MPLRPWFGSPRIAMVPSVFHKGELTPDASKRRYPLYGCPAWTNPGPPSPYLAWAAMRMAFAQSSDAVWESPNCRMWTGSPAWRDAKKLASAPGFSIPVFTAAILASISLRAARRIAAVTGAAAGRFFFFLGGTAAQITATKRIRAPALLVTLLVIGRPRDLDNPASALPRKARPLWRR